jgi:capsid portal protein
MMGIDPVGYVQQVAMNMDQLTGRAEIETALDEVEYLFEVIPPDLQDLAEQVIERLRQKLANAS